MIKKKQQTAAGLFQSQQEDLMNDLDFDKHFCHNFTNTHKKKKTVNLFVTVFGYKNISEG